MGSSEIIQRRAQASLGDGRNAPEWVAGINRNAWPEWIGTGAGIARNQWPECIEIRKIGRLPETMDG